jgi:hypothetical protein
MKLILDQALTLHSINTNEKLPDQLVEWLDGWPDNHRHRKKQADCRMLREREGQGADHYHFIPKYCIGICMNRPQNIVIRWVCNDRDNQPSHSLVVEPEISAPATSNPANGHDPELMKYSLHIPNTLIFKISFPLPFIFQSDFHISILYTFLVYQFKLQVQPVATSWISLG